jgi:tripartite-type tricarboxylate transporter receptor subunit TctC
MIAMRFLAWAFFAGPLALGADAAVAQIISGKFIRIVTSEPGSTNDWSARLIAQDLTRSLGQQTIVENRGSLAVEYAVKAPPDGNTLLYYGNSVWLLPLLRENAPYDPVKDLAPVALTTIAPVVLVAHPSLPVKSVRELIALAKARPGELNYAAGTIGASTHLAMEMFKSMAGVRLVRVPYKGTGPSVIALLGGEVHMMFSPLGSVSTHIKSGKLRALAIGNEQPSALAPGLPTVAESGVRGYEASSITGIFVPANTPAAIVSRLNQEIVRGLTRTGVREKFFDAGLEVIGGSPEDFAAKMKSEITKWSKVIREAGIREDQ